MSDEEVQKVEEQLKAAGITEENENANEGQSTETTTEETSTSEERVLTDFEKEQVVKGWNPDGPKSAEEFERATPLYEELKVRGKEIKALRRTINELKEHMDKQKVAAYEQAVADLRDQRVQALEEGNSALVDEIDESRRELEANKPVEVHPAVTEFQERNADWMSDTSFEAMEMQRFTMDRDRQLANRNLDPEEHMAILEEHVKKQFPDYFNPRTENDDLGRGSAVESGVSNSATVAKKQKFGFRDLNSEQKQVARDFEKMGIMKVDEYIKQLEINGDLTNE